MSKIQYGKKWYDMYLSILHAPAREALEEATTILHTKNQPEKALEFANEAKKTLERLNAQLSQALSSYAEPWKEKVGGELIKTNTLIKNIENELYPCVA